MSITCSKHLPGNHTVHESILYARQEKATSSQICMHRHKRLRYANTRNRQKRLFTDTKSYMIRFFLDRRMPSHNLLSLPFRRHFVHLTIILSGRMSRISKFLSYVSAFPTFPASAKHFPNLESWERVSFGVEDDLCKWKEIVGAEEEEKVFQSFGLLWISLAISIRRKKKS